MKTINEVCSFLEGQAQNLDDIFVFSFKTNGTYESNKIFNKGNGLEGTSVEFPEIKNIVFTDTVNNERTDLLSYMKKANYNEKNGDGELVVAFDGKTKTVSMFAVHNTNLGPALGGLREKNYSNFDSMLTDTLRLAKAMTYKAAIANTGTGGGKATRMVPLGIRQEANFAFARLLNFINEQRKQRGVKPYITAEDSNTCCKDFDDVDKISDYATCRSLNVGGSGNPSPVTAIGVYHAAKSGAEFAFKDKKLNDKVVLISGVGQCGYELAKNYVVNDVKKIICAEISKERIEWVKNQFGRMRETKKIEFLCYTKSQLKNQEFLGHLANKIDVFSPCTLGRSISDNNIGVLENSRLKLICGSENNQLADEEKHGKMLHDFNILYIPDFVANAGGLINCSKEIAGRTFLLADTIQQTKNIAHSVREIIEISRKEDIPTYLAANRLAEERFMRVS